MVRSLIYHVLDYLSAKIAAWMVRRYKRDVAYQIINALADACEYMFGEIEWR